MASERTPRKPKFGEGFKPGYIFGKSVEWPISGWKRFIGKGFLKAVLGIRRSEKFANFFGEGGIWKYWVTPLDKYSLLKDFVLSSFLKGRLDKAKASGHSLRVLEVGVGGGQQWEKLAQHPALDLHATVLSKTYGKALEGRAKNATAAKLHRHFERNSFDFVVSHMGMHGMELAGVENALWLLKPGGELLLTADTGEEKLQKTIARAGSNYQVVQQRSVTTDKGPMWTVRLRKK